jgi:DNA-binding MarR family transcriptional regulator
MSREQSAARLIAALRISHNANDALDEAFAHLLQVNRTDGRCLDILHRVGRITAGDLAAHAGLTTGAITVVADRLEHAGYLRRVRQAGDRRKVHVELTERAQTLGQLVYGPLQSIGLASMAQLPKGDMATIAQFLETSAALNRTVAALLSDVIAAGDAGATAEDLAQRFSDWAQAKSGQISAKLAEVWTKAPKDAVAER